MNASDQTLSIEKWTQITCNSVGDNITAMTGLECSILDEPSHPAFESGGYIQLVTPNESVQVGFGSTVKGCIALTRLFLALDDDDEDPPEKDVRDAMGELANVVAGAIKGAALEELPGTSVQMGLPFFVYGRISPVGILADQLVCLMVGEIPLSLHVMHMAQARKVWRAAV